MEKYPKFNNFTIKLRMLYVCFVGEQLFLWHNANNHPKNS